MVKPKEKSVLSQDDLNRLLTAIRDIDQSILQLRKMLHHTLKADDGQSDETDAASTSSKTLH